MQVQKIAPCLWFDNQAQEAAEFYCSVFKNSKLIQSNPMTATFELEGTRFMGLNGGPRFQFTEAVSFFVSCDSQEEVDYFWEKLTANGGKESRCGWLVDKFGLSWQIVPTAFMKLASDPDQSKTKRVFDALYTMNKIDISRLQQAYNGQ